MLCYLILLVLPVINCAEIRNENVHRSVDLSNQMITFTDEIEFVNIGKKPVHEYKYVLDPTIQTAKLQFSHESVKLDNRTYSVNFTDSILPNGHYSFNVNAVVLDELSIINVQGPERYIRYKTNLEYYSAYKTLFYMVTYNIFEKGEIVHPEPKQPAQKTKFSLNVKDVRPYSYTEFYMIYINKAPFYLVTNLDRKIDISHFGFIMVEDKVTVTNRGPKSKEPYQSVPGRARTKLRTILPELAFNVKLFDEIGNNSKSQLYYVDYVTILGFETRYELLMSWKTEYIIQYTVPAYPYLRTVNDTYILSMPVVDDILPFAFVQKAKTVVLLPEDSKHIATNITDDNVKVGSLEVVTSGLAPLREAVVFDTVKLASGFTPSFFITYVRGPFHLFKPALYIITYIESVFLCYLFVSYTKPMLALRKC